jgi:TatA/E family protein of Tat protein translocase
MYFAFFSFGGGEIFIVFLAVLVLFGASKIPDLARTLGKGMNEFRKATDEIKKEFREGTEDFRNDLKDSQRELDEHVRDIKQNLDEPEGYDPYDNTDVTNKKEIDSKSEDNTSAKED